MAIQRTLKKAGNTAVSLLEKASKDPRKTEDMLMVACAAGIGGCQAYVTYNTGDPGKLSGAVIKMYASFITSTLTEVIKIPFDVASGAAGQAASAAAEAAKEEFMGGELGLGFGAQDYLEKETGWHAGEYAGRLGRWWRDL